MRSVHPRVAAGCCESIEKREAAGAVAGASSSSSSRAEAEEPETNATLVVTMRLLDARDLEVEVHSFLFELLAT